MERPFKHETKTFINILKGLGEFVTFQAFLPKNTLSTHGDHYFEHPLNTPVEPVTSLPYEVRTEPSVDGKDL